MKRKMNAKEFKEALTLAGLDFEILGYEGLLNTLSIYYNIQANEYTNRGFEELGNDTMKISHKLYVILCTRGYYSN